MLEDTALLLLILGGIEREPEITRECLGEVSPRDRNPAQRDRFAIDEQAQVRLRVADVENQSRDVVETEKRRQVRKRCALALDHARFELHAPQRGEVNFDLGARRDRHQYVRLIGSSENLLVREQDVRERKRKLFVDLERERRCDALGAGEGEAQMALGQPLGRDRRDQRLRREIPTLDPELDRRLDLLRRRIARKLELGEANELRTAKSGAELGDLDRPRADVEPDDASLEHQQPNRK